MISQMLKKIILISTAAVSIIFFVFALILFFSGGIELLKYPLFVSDTLPVKATILRYEQSEKGNDSQRRKILYAPVYQFTDLSGKERIIETGKFQKTRVGKVGTKVSILYKKDNPEKVFRVRREEENYRSVMTMILGLIIGLISLLPVNLLRKVKGFEKIKGYGNF